MATDDSLAVLKKFLLPGGDYASAGVLENDPELALPSATAPESDVNDGFAAASPMQRIASNERLKQVLGLGPSPELQQQQKDMTAQDEAINAARIAANPEVGAEADKAYKEKLALAAAPNQAAAAGNLALQQDQQKATKDLVGSIGEPGAIGSMRMGINAEGKPTFAPATAEPAQVMAQQHAAQVGLGGISALRNIVDTLNKKGYVGPTAGRLGEALTTSGLDAYLMDPDAAQKFNDFKTQASLVKSNMAMAHGGARGGSSPALAARFDAMINPHQSAASLQGGLDAFERWLTAYANAKSGPELDAADAALGVGNEPATGADTNYVSTDPNRGRQ